MDRMNGAAQLQDLYGYRARIGAIYMASSTVMEPEFTAMAPDGVTFHTSRIHLPEATVQGLRNMMEGDEVERCARELARAPLHSMVFVGTSASFLEGKGYDSTVCSRMKSVSNGIPVTTASTAALHALHVVGAQSITLATPYVDEVTERGRKFFEQNGFRVDYAEGLGIKDDPALAEVPTQEVYSFVRKVARSESDAVFISCTNFRTVGAIAALEEDLDKPVISAVQASFWGALRLAGVRATVPGYGRLLQLQAASDMLK